MINTFSCPSPNVDFRDSINLGCNTCGSAYTSGTRCTKCARRVTMCSLCERPTRGQYRECPGCHHGGHSYHLSVRAYCLEACFDCLLVLIASIEPVVRIQKDMLCFASPTRRLIAVPCQGVQSIPPRKCRPLFYAFCPRFTSPIDLIVCPSCARHWSFFCLIVDFA